MAKAITITENKEGFFLDSNKNPYECWSCGAKLKRVQREFGFCSVKEKGWLSKELKDTRAAKRYNIYIKKVKPN